MSDKKETTAERIERMKRDKEAAKVAAKENSPTLVSQLTHESDGEPDFSRLAEKLQERKEETAITSPEWVKMTIYIDKPIAEAFKALCVEHGDQRKYSTEAFKDFVQKKARELDIK